MNSKADGISFSCAISGKTEKGKEGRNKRHDVLNGHKRGFPQPYRIIDYRQVASHTASMLKHLVYLLIYTFLQGYSFSVNAEEINVILIGGQSNATGQAYVRNIPACFKTDERVLLYYSGHLKGPGPAERVIPLSPASETPDRFGVELSLGTALQKKFPQKKWAIIKHARSGSNLYQQWNPGETPQDKQGEEYAKLMKTIKDGLEAMKKQGYEPILQGMVWQQGEGDARDIAGEKASQAYGKNLRRLIERVREDLKEPDLPFVYGSVLPVSIMPRFPGRDEVRRGQKEVAESSGTPLSIKNAVYVPADKLQLRSTDFRTPEPSDQLHLGTYGILTLGERFAAALEREWKESR